MAIAVKLADLSEIQIKTVDTHLKIDAQSFSNSFYGSNGESILFYRIDGENKIWLPLFYAQRLFNKLHFNRDRLNPIPPFSSTAYSMNFSWRYWQPPLIEQAQKSLAEYGTCTLATPPGSGKTIMGTYLSLAPYKETNFLPQITLIICPRRPLIKQWIKTLAKITPYGFMIDPQAKKQYLTVHTRMAMERKPIGFIISTPGLINAVPQNILAIVGTLIVDEAHMCCTSNSVRALLSTQPERVILCTATPCRQDNYIKMLYCIAGQHQIDSCPLKPYRVFKINTGWIFPETQQVINIFGRRQVTVNPTALEKRYSTSPRYCQLLLYLIQHLVQQSRKIIVVSRFKFMFNVLEPLLSAAQVPFSTFYGNTQKFNEAPILLSTIGKGGTGFDEENFCDQFSGLAINTVVLASSIAFSGLLFQVIGRGLRGEDPWVFDIAHENKSLQNRANDRKQLYRKTNGDINLWEISQELHVYLDQFEL